MKFLSSIWFVLVLFFCCLIFCSTVILVFLVVRIFQSDSVAHDAGHKVAIYWAKTIMFLIPGWTSVIEGVENLPKDQKFVMVSNHESMTDIFVILLLGIQFRYLSKASMLRVPLFGQAMIAAGYIGVDRGNPKSHRLALAETRKIIDSGRPVLFFAEGTRSADGNLLPFKVGAFKLAEETNSTILPVCLVGTRKLLIKGSISPGKSRVKVIVLPKLDRLADESLQNWAQRARTEIMECRNAN
jgi:1-acyl-sn-glycerol-3-phosphate acyltransferase